MNGRRIALRSDRSWTGVVTGPENERGAVPVRLDNGLGDAVLPTGSLVFLDDLASKEWPPDGLETKGAANL